VSSSDKTVWLLAPIAAGLAQPIIWQMNNRVARALGDTEAAALLHLVGAVAGLGWMAVGLRGGGSGGLATIPWWAWLGGAVGVSCFAAVSRAMPKLGLAACFAIIVAAQLIGGLVFEQTGWMGATLRDATWDRWLGAGLLVVGAWLVSR
jgi:transporter family-2 protein